MAHYAIMASSERDSKGWRSCAILQAASIESAAFQAKALRDGGGLAFVQRPSRFRLRRATRAEVRLMIAFFHSFGALSLLLASKEEQDSAMARRRKLLLSFFMGLYIDPEAMRRRYVDGSPFAGSVDGSGGDERPDAASVAESEAESASYEEGEMSTEEALLLAGDVSDSLESSESFSEASADAIDESSQEAALAAILASPEANDGGKGRDESFDLGIL